MPHYRYAERLTAEQAFRSLSVPDLTPLARLVADAPPGRKGELVELLTQTMRDGTKLRHLYRGLEEGDQAAVQEAVHAADGVLDEARYRAKYGRRPGFGGTRSPATLRLFFPASASLPSDLQEALRDFVPAPRPAGLASAPELPEFIEQKYVHWEDQLGGGEKQGSGVEQVPLAAQATEAAALHDVHAVLRLIEAGKVGVSATTRRPGQAALNAVAGALHSGDFYTGMEGGPEGFGGELDREDQEGVRIRAFAWPMIAQAAGLAELSGTRLQLTASGRKALTQPAAAVLRVAWSKWLGTTLLDEFSRITPIKGQGGKGKRQLTAVPGRRKVVAGALEDCPPGEWVAIDELYRYMRASGRVFAVTRDPWSLYLSDPHYGSLGYEGSHDWTILQGRFILAFLFEYAATLGLIDVAYLSPVGARSDYSDRWGADDLLYLSRYDGLFYFRVNGLGAWILGHTERYQVATVVESVLKVLPNLEVAVTGRPLAPGDALFLDRFAERVSEAVWRLSRAKCLKVMEEGLSLVQLEEFLQTRSSAPLPQPASVFLSDLQARAGQLQDLGAARLVECASPSLAVLLVSDRTLRRYCRLAGERCIVFRAGDEEIVRRALRELGYTLPPAGGLK